MNDNEKKAMTSALIGNDAEATDTLLGVYLNVAKDAILNRLYPWGIPTTVTDVPTEYEVVQCRLASSYFLRRGAEGELIHNENGINRTYESSDALELLKTVISYAKVV